MKTKIAKKISMYRYGFTAVSTETKLVDNVLVTSVTYHQS